MPERLELLGYPLDAVDLEGAVRVLLGWMDAPGAQPHTVITLNPEIVVQADADLELARVIRQADLVTADGVGIVWAAKRLLRRELPGRAPGYDLSVRLLEERGPSLRVFFLGGKPGVAEAAAQRARALYGVQVVGSAHGYFKHDGVEDRAVAERIRDARPELLLTALGAGKQEGFNERFRDLMGVPVSIGVGGTLDVLAGTANLAPEWTRRLGVEWIWRVAGDRKRWGRAPRLGQFVLRVLRTR
ncbi:N-acetylglucosaminyldiphosphoundecaprenol N-acetyl-beta-D-mannosaminyltransferase [Deinobacterium chartae]|uniref:N-acetylglucosaminyldiphosphoundecaprenol N-acetyl-beta-D-mannosaminyltransferase n=1 Tax=Deinobacterium chartae TaxID=521158 RepID=A0A841HY41_9DEIO|nr:N-acetylglucosaminyldiphosphoundecaprenol N-acetyl-beta-D-mannosaminyltransferase [Deinobacterium chartae]